MNTWQLAMRLLRRDWRSGELRVLMLAVVIAVASVSSVGFFTDRIEQALAQQANSLLGGDLVVAADRPIRDDLITAATQLKLRHSEIRGFLSMSVADGRSQLAEVKAVSPGYPLRGEMRVAPARFAPDAPAAGVPVPGTAWADARLLGDLDIEVGDRLQLGDSVFTVSAVISHEPDRGGSLFSIAPRLLINDADVAATGLLQPGSRAQYRLLVAGDAETVATYRRAIEPDLQRGERLESVEEGRPEMRSALERARQFLGLAGMVSVMLAGVAIAAATRRFVTRHLDHVAILRALGATQSVILRAYLWQMLSLALLASAVGCAVGYAAQQVLADVLGSLAATTLPAPSWRPVAAGMAAGLITVLGFALPPLLHLRHVPTLRVLRREMGAMPGPSAAAYGLGLAALGALIVWQAGDLRLGLYVLAGGVATVAVLALTAAGMLALLSRVQTRLGGVWRFGIANMVRRARGSVSQVVAFGLGLLALLVLGVVRVDLLAAWEASLPREAPNRFVINIQPQQLDDVRTFFRDEGMGEPKLFPMVRGRLVAINGASLTPEKYGEDRARRLVEREFNLSWAAEPRADNQLVAGRWWDADQRDEAAWSVEEGIAQTLGIKLGDTLTYQVGGDTVSARVANLRKVEWDSFQVNFFVIASPGVLDDAATTYITSFYLAPDSFELLSRFVQRFPNATVIDVAAIMGQVRQVIDKVVLAMEYVFVFTVLAGLMVLFAAIQATLDERLLEGAVLRTLGAGRRQVLAGTAIEFAGTGAVAGLVAASGAALLGYVLAEQFFKVEYSLNPGLWLWGVSGGALIVGVAGLLGTRFVVRRPPWRTLRALQGQ
ncbi:MAG: FtsX-like permease family protein [Pseudomonadota bacterium]